MICLRTFNSLPELQTLGAVILEKKIQGWDGSTFEMAMRENDWLEHFVPRIDWPIYLIPYQSLDRTPRLFGVPVVFSDTVPSGVVVLNGKPRRDLAQVPA